MKIAIFTDTYLPEINGIVTSIKNFSERMAKKGHKIYIFCPTYAESFSYQVPGIRIIRFPSFSFATNKNTKIAYPSISKITKEIRKIKPDLIHIQTPMNLGVAGLLTAKIFDIPNIQTYHTYIPDFMVYVSPTKLLGLDGFYDKMLDTALVQKVIKSPAFKQLENVREDGDAVNKKLSEALNIKRFGPKLSFSERFAWNFTRFLYGRADLVLAPSNSLCEILRHHHVRAQIEFQSNGIEYDYFLKKTDYNLTGRIVHVGRLGLEKDVGVIIKAVRLLLPGYPNLKLDIIGDGPAREPLERLVEKMGLGENVEFLGFRPRDVLRKEYRKYDFFVTASPIETQGLVILEAMASGLPALGVNKLAAPEIIIDSKTGFLAKPKNPKSLAEKMELLLNDPKRNKALGDRAKKLAFSHNIDGEVDKLEHYYTEMVFNRLKEENI